MSIASLARRQRREAERNTPKPDLSGPPRAIITLTATDDTGGYTIGLGLHGALQSHLNPEQDKFDLQVVDLVALALTSLVRDQSPDFIAALEKVKIEVLGADAALDAASVEEPA